jgi:hypothetical protein
MNKDNYFLKNANADVLCKAQFLILDTSEKPPDVYSFKEGKNLKSFSTRILVYTDYRHTKRGINNSLRPEFKPQSQISIWDVDKKA